jgi:hypothetical protein
MPCNAKLQRKKKTSKLHSFPKNLVVVQPVNKFLTQPQIYFRVFSTSLQNLSWDISNKFTLTHFTFLRLSITYPRLPCVAALKDFPTKILNVLLTYFLTYATHSCCVLTKSHTHYMSQLHAMYHTHTHTSLHSWPLKMGRVDDPETSVRNYQYSLRNSPEERISQLLSFQSFRFF